MSTTHEISSLLLLLLHFYLYNENFPCRSSDKPLRGSVSPLPRMICTPHRNRRYEQPTSAFPSVARFPGLSLLPRPRPSPVLRSPPNHRCRSKNRRLAPTRLSSVHAPLNVLTCGCARLRVVMFVSEKCWTAIFKRGRCKFSFGHSGVGGGETVKLCYTGGRVKVKL